MDDNINKGTSRVRILCTTKVLIVTINQSGKRHTPSVHLHNTTPTCTKNVSFSGVTITPIGDSHCCFNLIDGSFEERSQNFCNVDGRLKDW